MQRETVTFSEFKKHFILQPDGYFPVYANIQEDDDGNFQKIVNIDMICEWRIADGKIQLIEVPFETDEQYEEIRSYMRLTTELLRKAILDNIDKLDEYKKLIE